ncbi:hypothetical protein NDU88_001316 [Pleurodeles waltl]|uniref:Uncharacterized protein n=1 Tax=Pleurodeles waltl TaxID=8319 RepID=A0AAV7KQ12_PLEWA|nr:hypothetical protein NDU88_001316 [Pleurodeles waltl]
MSASANQASCGRRGPWARRRVIPLVLAREEAGGPRHQLHRCPERYLPSSLPPTRQPSTAGPTAWERKARRQRRLHCTRRPPPEINRLACATLR